MARNETPSELGIRAIQQIASQPVMEAGGADLEGAGAGDRTSAARQESAEERHARIAEVAYRNAEKRGFAAGGELDDWLAAEREVMREDAADHPDVV